MYVASDAELILGDTEFLTRTASALARELKSQSFDAILTAEAKSIALAYELARKLGHRRFLVARKTVKSYMGDYLREGLKSITTDSLQQLLLTAEERGYLSGKRVCLLDDVVSTGATLDALERIAQKAGAEVTCRAAIWREGPWYTRGLVFLGTLPVFITEGHEPAAVQARSGRG